MAKKASLRDIILQDASLLLSARTRFERPLQEFLVPQSGTGHAHQGHSAFKDNRCPNLTIEEYYNILMNNPKAFISLRKGRQEYINQIKSWCRTSLEYLEKRRNAIGWEETLDEVKKYSIDSFALCGIPSNASQRVYSHQGVLTGVFLGGHLDSESSRGLLNERIKNMLKTRSRMNPDLAARIASIRERPLRRGITKAIHTDTLISKGMTLAGLSKYQGQAKRDFLAENDFVDERGNVRNIEFVEALVSLGIAEDCSTDYKNPNIVSGYIELTPGIGASDDAAYLAASLMFGRNFSHGYDISAGFYMNDFIDTLDKCCMEITPEGQDEELGSFVNQRFRKITGSDLLDYEQILAWMYMSSRGIPTFPSSSQRYFLQAASKDPKRSNLDITPIEIYDEFAERTFNRDLDDFHPPNILVDFERIHVMDFLRDFRKRWNEVREECRETGIFPEEYFPDYFSDPQAKR